MAWTFCSEQDVRDIQSMPPTIPDIWSDMVEGMIREEIGQSDLGLELTEYTETRSGDGTNFLRLKKSPIVSVSSLVVDGVEIGTSDYYIGPYFVQLTSSNFTTGVRNVSITYQAGGGDITYDIKMAAVMMIVAINNYYGRAGADASIKWATMDDAGQRGGEPTANTKIGLASHLQGIMRSILKQKRIKIA